MNPVIFQVKSAVKVASCTMGHSTCHPVPEVCKRKGKNSAGATIFFLGKT